MIKMYRYYKINKIFPTLLKVDIDRFRVYKRVTRERITRMKYKRKIVDMTHTQPNENIKFCTQ